MRLQGFRSCLYTALRRQEVSPAVSTPYCTSPDTSGRVYSCLRAVFNAVSVLAYAWHLSAVSERLWPIAPSPGEHDIFGSFLDVLILT